MPNGTAFTVPLVFSLDRPIFILSALLIGNRTWKNADLEKKNPRFHRFTCT